MVCAVYGVVYGVVDVVQCGCILCAVCSMMCTCVRMYVVYVV